MQDTSKFKDLEDRVARLEAELDLIREYLRARPMSKAQRRALNARLAARARAAKPVGEGKGAVRTKKTKRSLEKDTQ